MCRRAALSRHKECAYHAMRLSLIVAVARNGVIGNQGQLPWRLSADLKRFKSLTMGHHLIMGRKTFDSLNGRELPGRITIVLTRSGQVPPHIQQAATLDEALQMSAGDDEAFVIGGAEIFALALPQADRLYITWVEADVAGDVSLPPIDLTQWRLLEETAVPADAKNEYPTRFCVYERGGGER
jgi:dihydrofolate reductase